MNIVEKAEKNNTENQKMEELLKIVQQYTEDDFQKIISEKKDFFFLYHLSPMRRNILEWYPFKKDAKVLEIDAECGAITGCIADKVLQVTSLENNDLQRQINECRNSKKENLRVFTGTYDKMENELERDYDYIVMVGSFAKASDYFADEKPYHTFIKSAFNHLKDGGEILIACDNRIGMKYWSGCQEELYSDYFIGIQDYIGFDNHKMRNFSKKEIENILQEISNLEYKFYYPYPDYKFPMAIYSDEYLPKKAELSMNIRNFDRSRLLLFDETKAFDGIIGAGLFPEFSNSFLLRIKKGD